jgi:hypothetical protein
MLENILNKVLEWSITEIRHAVNGADITNIITKENTTKACKCAHETGSITVSVLHYFHKTYSLSF